MSFDLDVHSPEAEVLLRAALCRELLQAGWHADVSEEGSKQARLSLPISASDDFIAARSPEVARSMEALLDQGDLAGVERLAHEEDIGGCEIYAEAGFRAFADASEEEREEIESSLGPRVVAEMRAARTSYYLRTSAGRSAVAFRLQMDAWKAVGRLSRGLFEDPQSGRYALWDGARFKLLGEPAEGAEPDALFSTLQRHGFAIDDSDPLEGRQLRLDRLDIPDMERLLQIVRSETPSFVGDAIIESMVDEFGFVKGRPFRELHRDWFATRRKKDDFPH